MGRPRILQTVPAPSCLSALYARVPSYLLAEVYRGRFHPQSLSQILLLPLGLCLGLAGNPVLMVSLKISAGNNQSRALAPFPTLSPKYHLLARLSDRCCRVSSLGRLACGEPLG